MRDREPTIRSRELGLAMSRAADAKGMNASEIAHRLGWSNSKVSRLYSGKRGSGNTEDISALLAICDIVSPNATNSSSWPATPTSPAGGRNSVTASQQNCAPSSTTRTRLS